MRRPTFARCSLTLVSSTSASKMIMSSYARMRASPPSGPDPSGSGAPYARGRASIDRWTLPDAAPDSQERAACGGQALQEPPRETADPWSRPSWPRSPWGTSTAMRYGPAGLVLGQVAAEAGHGSMSALDTNEPSTRNQAIESGRRVFFIQKPEEVSPSNTKAIPARPPRPGSLTFIRPRDRSAGVSATHTHHWRVEPSGMVTTRVTERYPWGATRPGAGAGAGAAPPPPAVVGVVAGGAVVGAVVVVVDVV